MGEVGGGRRRGRRGEVGAGRRVLRGAGVRRVGRLPAAGAALVVGVGLAVGGGGGVGEVEVLLAGGGGLHGGGDLLVVTPVLRRAGQPCNNKQAECWGSYRNNNNN